VKRAKHALPRAKPPRLSVAEIKALVRYRDGYRCVECSLSAREHVRLTKKTLEVHRVVPGSRYTVKGCVTLCRKCHDKMPSREPGAPDFASSDGRVIITLQVVPELAAALRLFAKQQRRTIQATFTLALEKHLRAEGLWPPPDEQEDE